MPLAAHIDTLRDAHKTELGGARTEDLLEDARVLVGRELARVEDLLAGAVRDGASPGPEAGDHLLAAGGKRVRPMLALLAAEALGGINETTREVAMVSELIHLATLLHDDVVDDAPERRGRATAGRVYGNAVSVLAGDLLLTTALGRTQALGQPDLLASLITTLRALVDGELIQLRGRRGLVLSRESYEAIVEGKTASLFVWAARAGASSIAVDARDAAKHASYTDALGTFGRHLGLAFQIVDDLIDYVGSETGKSLYADLREGKATLPVIVAAERDPGLLAELQACARGEREGAEATLAARIVATGACDDVRARAEAETRAALAALDRLPPGRAVTLLAAVATRLSARLA
jgi:octaprenyl-diphosphate synthase